MSRSVPLILSLFAMASPGPAVAEPVPCHGTDVLERTTYRMGTLLRIRVERTERDCASAAVSAAFTEVARLEAMLSSWTADSEIGRINTAVAHARLDLSGELAALLAEAGVWVERTAGAFDPAVGALIDVWDLRGAGRLPLPAALVAARQSTGWSHLQLEDQTLVRGPRGWWLDTGGFGKGAALRAAGAKLRAHGVRAAVLDFGGQLLVLGEAEVSVADPRLRDVSRARVRARDQSVATTSAAERFVEADGRRLGHVVDPRTGHPVPAWGSVTVLTPDALVADVLSTALFVMGRDAALAWAAGQDVGVLVLWEDEGRVHAAWNHAMDSFVLDAPTRGAQSSISKRK